MPQHATGRATTHIGYITARQPHSTFIVISNDKGYDPMLEHSRDLGFLTTRREFRKVRAPALPDQADALIAKMVDATKQNQVGNSGNLTPPVKNQQPRPRSKPASKRVSTKTAPAKKVVANKAATKKVVATENAATRPPIKKAAAAPKQSKPPATDAQLVQRVLATLKKMPANKPTRRTGLLKVIATHVPDGTSQAARVQKVCDALEKARHLAFSADGLKVSYPTLKGTKAKAV